MILSSAGLAAAQIFRPKFLGSLTKSIGLVILVFIGLWYAASELFSWAASTWFAGWEWTVTVFNWLFGLGIILGAPFILAPAVALFAGLFLDDIAEDVERATPPGAPVGQALPMLEALLGSLRFLLLVIAVNLTCLILLILPGINLMIFFLANGYLLGREYFEFVALRHHDRTTAARLRKDHAGEIFGAGLLIALLLSVPLINLVTPFFATAMMVHIHRAIEKTRPEVS